MEHLSNPRYISKDQKCVRAAERNLPSHTHQGKKLRDILMSDYSNLSYAEFHHKLTRDPDNAISESYSKKIHILEGVTCKEDEVVRFMSNVPAFLEKGNNFPGKALNFGVLDWKQLEKWQYKQKQMARGSPASSNTTLFSTDGSSNRSSRAQSCSPAHQGNHRVSLQSSPKEGNIQDAKILSSRGPSRSPADREMHNDVVQSHPPKVYNRGLKSQETDRGNTGKFEDSPVITGNHLSKQQKVLAARQLYEEKVSYLKSVSGMEQRPTFDMNESVTSRKGKTKILGSESAKQKLKLQETRVEINSCSGVSASTSTVNDELSKRPERESISGRDDLERSLPHSAKMRHSLSRISDQGDKNLFKEPHKSSYPVRMFSSPTRSRNIEENQPVVSSGKIFEESDVRKGFESMPKARNSSPIRRLSFTMGKMIKNAAARDDSPLCRSSSKDCVTRSQSEEAITSFIDTPCNDESSSNKVKGRSSPLRRLLDPLLKPRVSNSSEQSKKHPASTVGTKKSGNDQPDVCAGRSVKLRSRSASCSINNVNSRSSSLQALLQVSFKNGFPLFTFAIDNKGDMLAATIRKSFVPGKGHYNWTYTFFNVREIKRKSGSWLNYGGKVDGHGYVPNVVAQMKVSDSEDSNNLENDDDHITREFDLFAVDVGFGDHYVADFHPTDELAAIVAKLPRIPSEDPIKDGHSSYSWLDPSQETRSFTGTDGNLQSGDSFRSPNITTTVILPGGVHTIPSKGEVSRLAQRWRSGGSCDCGGWDLGCQLRIYANQREYRTKMGSSESSLSEDNFQLFPQVGQDKEPILSLSPFKERIYSVEFKSSLKLIQAFAVCISFIDCRRPAELSDPSNVLEKINSEIDVYEVPMPTKTSNHQVGAPARYLSYPPNSPVGRV